MIEFEFRIGTDLIKILLFCNPSVTQRRPSRGAYYPKSGPPGVVQGGQQATSSLSHNQAVDMVNQCINKRSVPKV